MICYKDMTFCPFSDTCTDSVDCPRAYTEAVKVDAERWWGSPDAPAAFYTDKPACYKEDADALRSL